MTEQHDGAPVRFRVVESEEGTMLAKLVARRLGNISAQEGRDLVRAGAVYLGHLRVRVPTVRVVPGERITVYPDALRHQALPSSAVKFVHRDPAFVVLDKPAGVPVVQTKQSARGTLSEALRRVLAQEGMKRPYVGVVHRLDRGASGLVLFTIRDIANKSLHQQFVEHRIARHYRVQVHGTTEGTTRCDAPLVELRDGKVKVAEQGESRARPAATTFETLDAREVSAGLSLLAASLETGRTHQIRVHAAHLGHPVVGDAKYGPDAGDGDGLRLHAHRLEFEHPLSGERIDVRTTPPTWASAVED
ncbi:MAG: RluA family pseudouridine synthase [Myxococcota bacterium]